MYLFIKLTSFPHLNRNRKPYVVILVGLALSNTKIHHYQQIEEHFVLLLIESMKLAGNLTNVILDEGIYIHSIFFFPYSYNFDIIFFSYLYDFHIMSTFSIIMILLY